MATFIAHYASPNASTNRAKGLFEFESSSRLGSKANQSDARMAMLEAFGKDAVSWTISRIEHKTGKKAAAQADGQLELDFREPVPERKRAIRVNRGQVK